MEQHIAKLMVRMAKFEFFMIKSRHDLAQVNGNGKVEGFQYSVLANLVEDVVPFNRFDFDESNFSIFRYEPPQYLVLRNNVLSWDGDGFEISNWEALLTKSYAQLRNNLAHGSKSLQAVQFTHGRSSLYLAAGHAVIDFIGSDVFKNPNWEASLEYS